MPKEQNGCLIMAVDKVFLEASLNRTDGEGEVRTGTCRPGGPTPA
jgi:hypothetical protein